MRRTIFTKSLRSAWVAGAVAALLLPIAGWAGEDDAAPRRAENKGETHTEGDGLTPEQRMAKRWPQPVLAGHLVGLPLLDDDDRELGRIRQVVRKPDGHVVLVTSSGGFLGFGRRDVGVPIETVVILARQLDLLDIPRDDFFKLETWRDDAGTPVAADDTLKIGISRR